MNLRSRKRICSWVLLILCPLLLICGCGSGKDNSGSQFDAGSYSQSETATENDSMEAGEAEGTGAEEASGEDPGEKTEKTEETAAKSEPEINTEMLIYTCTLKIDTLGAIPNFWKVSCSGGPTNTRISSREGMGRPKCLSATAAQLMIPSPESVRVPSRSNKNAFCICGMSFPVLVKRD